MAVSSNSKNRPWCRAGVFPSLDMGVTHCSLGYEISEAPGSLVFCGKASFQLWCVCWPAQFCPSHLSMFKALPQSASGPGKYQCFLPWAVTGIPSEGTAQGSTRQRTPSVEQENGLGTSYSLRRAPQRTPRPQHSYRGTWSETDMHKQSDAKEHAQSYTVHTRRNTQTPDTAKPIHSRRRHGRKDTRTQEVWIFLY